MTKKVLLVGGGTGGHILPMKNLSDELLLQGAQVEILAVDQPLDRNIVEENFISIPRHYLKTGKIHRYLTWKNLYEPFLIFVAIFKARKLLVTINPDVIFFKGGFLCFPVLIAARWMFPRIDAKLYLHESDSTQPALGRFISRYTQAVFSNFGVNARRLFYSPTSVPSKPSRIIRTKPKILVFGGSQGAQFINEMIVSQVPSLKQKYEITLITGPGKVVDYKGENFTQYEFLPVERLAQKIHDSDLVIMRASASVFQVLEAGKPSILIPLPSAARNHQYHNAKSLIDQGLAVMLEQSRDTEKELTNIIASALGNKMLLKSLKKAAITNDTKAITQLLLER